MSPAPRRPLRRAVRTPAVWRRAAVIGLPIGLIQVSLNQGDHWLRHEVTQVVLLKSLLSPLLSFGIALASSLATQVAEYRRQTSLL